MSEVPELHDVDVDGVRCFWVPSGRPTLQAQISFRHGVVDEPIGESGWQHLIEHLCLEQHQGHGGLDVNGSVSLHETTFEAHGEPEAVVAHLNAITAWLAAPALDGLAHERQVLRAESALRSGGPVAEALSWRYGAQGPGLAAYGEPGLGRADEDQLRARITRVFNAGNAVLALDGAPSAALRLGLPAGTLHPVPEAVPFETEPASYPSHQLVVSGIVPRDGGMFVGTSLVERALTERLRSGAGTAYAPWATYERLDRDNAIVVAGSDFGADVTGTVGAEVLDVMARLAADGPPAEWVQETVERTLRHMSDPYAAPALAFAAAHRHLHGTEPDTFDEMLERVRSMTVEQVAADVGDLRATLLLGAPREALAPAGLPVLAMPATDPHPAASKVRSINWPGDLTRLHLHPERIAISEGADSRAVALTEVAAYFTYEDGSRHLLQNDGYGLTIDPRWWRGGPEAVAAVDRMVPPERHLPQPSRNLEPVERMSAFTRWKAAAGRVMAESTLAGIVILTLLGTTALAAVFFFAMGKPSYIAIPQALVTALITSTFVVWSGVRSDRRRE